MNKKIILYAITLILALSIATALELPDNLKKINEYNQSQAASLSYLIAFLGGIFSLLSPCVLPLLPAFFAYTFGENKNITKMTLIFFLGMSSVFVLFGIILSFIGFLFADYRMWITVIAGILILIFGIITLFGKGFSFMNINYKPKENSKLSVFIFGALFSIGFTPCVGPILAAILVASSTLGILQAAILLFMYSLGFILPLFILSYFYDRYKLQNNPLFKGKEFNIGRLRLHTHKFIAGILLILLGVIYIIDRGTYIANKIDPFGTKEYFYTYNDKLIKLGINPLTGNLIGAIIIIILVAVGIYLLKRKDEK